MTFIRKEQGRLVKDFLMGEEQRREIARAAGVVSAATLLSRILGFVRDLIIARAFGAGTATDAFFAAFRLPNMLRELLGEGALSAAFVPVFTESLTRRGRQGAWRLVWSVLTLLIVILVLVCVTGILFAPFLVQLIAPGFQSIPSKLSLAVLLARIPQRARSPSGGVRPRSDQPSRLRKGATRAA